ncbi:VOC family protein [Roseicella frigidaeris]|uniref:Glyoxalase n=1 Tax=Roseicella frigidaeris TaxID=2230885 RepID=A0A327M3L7_9PROT|nr:VOC family protein [Roseicella frigidaeris]RAI56924.1 glyoxalase [Roseicella frigidaeris]
MAVRRIVANIAAEDPSAAAGFYGGVLGLDCVMDHGWIMTFAAPCEAPGSAAPPQVSIAREGGNGMPVPDLSIEVDDLEAVLDRARAAGCAIPYGPVREAWGVRRFFLHDPFGRLLNILQHV